MKPGEGALTDPNGENFAVEMSYRGPHGAVETWFYDGYGSMSSALDHVNQWWDDAATGGTFVGAHVIVPGGALRMSHVHGDVQERSIYYLLDHADAPDEETFTYFEEAEHAAFRLADSRNVPIPIIRCNNAIVDTGGNHMQEVVATMIVTHNANGDASGRVDYTDAA